MPAKSCGTSSRCLAGAAQRCVARIGQPCRATWSSRGVALFSQAAFMAPMRQRAYTFWPGAPFPSVAAQTQHFDGQENPRCCGALGRLCHRRNRRGISA